LPGSLQGGRIPLRDGAGTILDETAHIVAKEATMQETKTTVKPMALDLEVEEIESHCNPGCGSSTTSRLCTCPIKASTMASLFTAKTSS
jgi:hypothetical protein